jgi:hypothetical protein
VTQLATNLVARGIVIVIALAMQAPLSFARPVYPIETYKRIGYAVFALTACFTTANIPLYPGSPWMVGSILLGLAVAAPIVGCFESRRLPDGQAVYCTTGKANRFPGHLLTNLLGAMAAFALWGVAHSVPGVADTFAKSLPHVDIAFNVMVPVSAAAAFQFIRSQQVDAFRKRDHQHNIDKAKSSVREKEIVGFSLRHRHQELNFFHLVFVTSVASTSGLLLVAHGLQATRVGLPAVSWLVIAAILATLAFLFACGAPKSRDSRAVYLTFLTGTPAALGGAILWLSCFRASAVKDATMVAVAGIGYVLFCVEGVFADWARDNGRGLPPLHYFVPMAVALVIAVLLGIAYFAR